MTTETKTKKRLYIGYIDCERATDRGYYGRAVTWRRAARRPEDPHGIVTWVAFTRLHTNIYDPNYILDRAGVPYAVQLNYGTRRY